MGSDLARVTMQKAAVPEEIQPSAGPKRPGISSRGLTGDVDEVGASAGSICGRGDRANLGFQKLFEDRTVPLLGLTGNSTFLSGM